MYDAFIYAAAMDAIDIEGIDLNVVADLVGVERKKRRTHILTPLGLEAAGTGSGAALRTRHPAIARTGILLAEQDFQTDLEEIYKDIVSGTINLSKNENISVANLGRIANCMTSLNKKLQGLGIEQNRAEQIAIAAADKAESENPERISNTVTRAKTYREAGYRTEAAEILQQALARSVSCIDWSKKGRIFLQELSVAQGHIDPICDILIGGLSIADIASLGDPSIVDAMMCLSGIGAACMVIPNLNKDNVYAKTLRAASFLGSLIRSDRERYYLRHAQRANKLGVENCNSETAYIWLHDGVKAAFRATNDQDLLAFMHQLGITRPENITFRRFMSLMGGLG